MTEQQRGMPCFRGIKSIDTPTWRWSSLFAVKKRTVLFILRSIVTINFVTMSAVLFGMRPTTEPSPEQPPAAPAVAIIAVAEPPPVRATLFQALRSKAEVVQQAARSVSMHTDTDLLVAQPPPVEPVLAEPEWSPPVWFPEDSRDALWVLDGMDQPAERTSRPQGFRSRAVFVYDLDSGRVLLSYAADSRRPVASLTKLVAALATISDSPQLEQEVCLDRSMLPSWPGAGSRMKYGRCTSGWDLLGAALVRSDNGAALALPSVSDLPLGPFVDRMNEVSHDLLMDMSSFADPSGVQDDNLSTARDMTRAVAAVAAHPVLAPVASAPYWDVEYIHGPRRRMRSTNRLLDERGIEVLAAKTGYTDTAGHCFSAAVRTDSGRTLALTTLGARRGRHRWSDVTDIIAWAERQ